MPHTLAIDDFVSSFLPHMEQIRELAKSYQLMFWLDIYPDSYHENVQIAPQTLSKLNDIGIELNVEITFLKDFCDGTEDELLSYLQKRTKTNPQGY